MTETTRTVFEKYEIRKSKAQRRAFRDYVQSVAAAEGYSCHEEDGSLGARNLVVGDPTTARVVYTAHYDTCARMPFPNFITPLSIGIYLCYQLVIVLGMFLPAIAISLGLGTVLSLCGVDAALAAALGAQSFGVVLLVACFFLMTGPANRHTANDNTSGVVTLLDTMTALPPALRGQVAFIFFDLEELGMFGSAGYASIHKKEMRDKLIINFDCVSDGDTILFAVKKKAADAVPLIEEAFPAGGKFTVKVATKGVFYPSDQAQFPRGVGVAALKRTRRGLLYMDRIHTARDTVFEEENIDFLVAGAVRLAAAVSEPPNT